MSGEVNMIPTLGEIRGGGGSLETFSGGGQLKKPPCRTLSPMMKSLAGLRQPRHRDGSCGGCGGGDRPVHLLLWTLLYDDKVSAASLSKWLGHDIPTASQVKLFT